jgi:hypothetical protein
MDRAYYKQLKQVKVAREKQRKQLIHQQSAKIPSADDPPMLQPERARPTPEPQ